MPSVTSHGLSSSIVVSYKTREEQQTVTQAEYLLIKRLEQQKVIAIKFVRDQYNLGLYEAKQIVDTIHDQPSIAE